MIPNLGLYLGALGFIFVIVMVVGNLIEHFEDVKPPTIPPPPKPPDTYGSAEFTPVRAYVPGGEEYVFQGVFFGKSSEPGAVTVPLQNHQGAPVCSVPGHNTLVCAKAGAGKGARVLIPTLLRNILNSALVIDVKAE